MSLIRRTSFSWGYFILFLTLSTGICIIFAIYNHWLGYHTSELETISRKADAMGALSAIFSGIGAAGVIVAVIMQSVELRNQREEIRDNTESLLLTTYLNALSTLRECYNLERKGDRFGDPPSAELPASVKYRMTVEKLESLVRHLECNEKELHHLEATTIARSEQWFHVLQSESDLFFRLWEHEMSKKDMVIHCQHQDGSKSESIGNVRGHELESVVHSIGEHFAGLSEELEKGEIRDKGWAIIEQQLNPMIDRIKELQKAAYVAAKEGSGDWNDSLRSEAQDELNASFLKVRADVELWKAMVKKQLETSKVVPFRSK